MLERMWCKGNSPPLLVGVQSCTSSLEIIWWFLRKVRIHLSQDPMIALFAIQPMDAQLYQKDTCSTMSIAALIVIARIWKHNG